MDTTAIDSLRTRATDHVRARLWADLLGLEAELRADTRYWVDLWGPACAVAAWHQGRADARDLLEECILGGFHQPELLGELFDESFGAGPGGAGLRARIVANAGPPPVELLRWPCAPPSLPPGLFRLDAAGERRLAERLPLRRDGAWATAELLLGWVTNQWRHSGTCHDDSGDANVVLDRAERGDRFACREYTIVLTQALNAVRIPARRISLYKAGYHAGVGTAHAVTEAWIDDLGGWVLLDGQNGAVWRDPDGRPLGVLDLQRRYQAGGRPRFTGTGRNFRGGNAELWFSHFHAAAVTGELAWSAGPFVPVMAGSAALTCARLNDSEAGTAPDLTAITTGIAGQPTVALTFAASHPYATGFQVTGTDGSTANLEPGRPLVLFSVPGEHSLTVATRTPYATLAAHPLRYAVR